uniref:Phosphate transporter n=1 Tax=viral metagenome TaxID=1070528 RepID=A0A6C0L0T0_9ZZZZ|tara:strand:+ start:5813 stop:7246 length:1434 start_codon:yes stop_codon:yes gene_type:complete
MYTWIIIGGGIFAIFASMGIGANDAANAFATSIGSKSLTTRNAVILACIFEASGAILMGNRVSDTIRKGIANHECFEDEPYVLMYGCMWVCFSVGLWLFLASKYEMPVSTTHSCVGAMIGMTMVIKGPDCVIWYEEKEYFPYIGGVGGIVISWIISPLFSSFVSFLLFGGLRNVLLRSSHSFENSLYAFPLIVGSTMTLNTFYIVYKGASGIGVDEMSIGEVVSWSFGLGGISTLAMIPLTKKYQNYIINSQDVEQEQESAPSDEDIEDVELKESRIFDNDGLENDTVLEIHKNAEVFDASTEELFKGLQIFTAICSSFSHGANDVANAIGPFSTMYVIYKNGKVDEKNELGDDAYWILAAGGVGISIGLALYGYKIIQAIGVKLCKITPSRGICIELASALVIITGSRLEIPLSTTHCQVGATLGVALLEDTRNFSGINYKVLYKTLFGWVATIIVVSLSTSILVSQGVYSPEVEE